MTVGRPTPVLHRKIGDDWRLPFRWTSAGAPTNLADCSARMQLRKRGGRVPAVSLTSEPNGGITITAGTGYVVALISREVTAGLDVGSYLTDLEMTFANGFVGSTETIEIVAGEDQTR
jgi:hypothetical protein